MTHAEIVKAVKTNAKHAAVTDIADDDLETAVLFVKVLAARRGITTPSGTTH